MGPPFFVPADIAALLVRARGILRTYRPSRFDEGELLILGRHLQIESAAVLVHVAIEREVRLLAFGRRVVLRLPQQFTL